MANTLQFAQGLLRRYLKMIMHVIAYFVACLILSIVATGLVLLSWSVGGPAIALMMAGSCVGFLIFGPVDRWLTSIIETGSMTLRAPLPDTA